jgi:site-specific DNA-methyltransferase (adenine-specific)
VRIPYDAETKKARSRSIFVGAKWLEVGYNPKDLWSVSRLHREHAERVDHPTQKPLEIIERMLKASCPPGGTVLDPFMGSGTTALAARKLGRHFVGFELNQDYCEIIQQRLALAAVPVKKKVTSARKKTSAVVPAKAGTHTEAALTLSMEGTATRGRSPVRGNDGVAANEQDLDNAIQGTPS